MWKQRLLAADKHYNQWASEYKVNQLYKYYRGKHWEDNSITSDKRYAFNLFASSLDLKTAGLIFSNPRFHVNCEPGSMYDYNIDQAVRGAQLKEDLLNTIFKRKSLKFSSKLKQVLLDSYFRFGVMEVGYSEDILNDQTAFLELKSWENEDLQGSERDKPVKGAVTKASPHERFYTKRIPAHRFRVEPSNAVDLEDHRWCGYYEWQDINVLKNSPGIKWPKDYEMGAIKSNPNDTASGDMARSAEDSLNPFLSTEGQTVKIWHIVDQVAKKRLILLEDHDDPILEDPLDIMPFQVLRWRLLNEGFYPKPLTFDWLPVQKEINECREQERGIRRRFIQRYQYLEGIDPDELNKFIAGAEIIKTQVQDAIRPIGVPQSSAGDWAELRVTQSEFNIISGTSSEARGSVDRETATAAKITNQRAMIRESQEQLDFETFVSEIGSTMLAFAENHMEGNLWIKVTSPDDPSMLAMVQDDLPVYKNIGAAHIKDGYDYSVSCHVENATPAAMENDKQAFLTFVSLVSQNPFLAANPILIREAAYKVGYRNEKAIKQMQQTALQAVMAKAVQGAQQAGINPDNAQKAQMAQQGTPDNMAMEKQMSQQMGGQ